MDNSAQVRWILKPLWFTLCLLPFVWMNLEAFKVIPSSLGDDPIKATQEFMGVWAFRLLLITLALSPLREITGQTWPIRLRRMTGLFVLFYAFMHALNYAGADFQLDWPAMFDDVLERPFIAVGALGLVGLLLLGFTSTHGWQRRLGRRWKSLHKLVYAIAILAAVHFWWQAEDSYWEPALYTLVMAALLSSRVRPLWINPGSDPRF